MLGATLNRPDVDGHSAGYLKHHLVAGLDLIEIDIRPNRYGPLERGWNRRVQLHWVEVDEAKLEEIRGHCHRVSQAAHLRLLAGGSLPDSVRKVIYLDADLLIQGDLFELWEQDLQGNIAAAVQDSYLQRYPTHYLPSEAAGADWPYFNSGMMVLDLDAWRSSRVERQYLEMVKKFPERVSLWWNSVGNASTWRDPA